MFRLLSFSVSNYKSFRDQQEISFLSEKLKTLRPKENQWESYIHNCLAIYGPNASGKSNLISALQYAINAINYSATGWLDLSYMPRAPFKLGNMEGEPSTFEFRFLIDDQLYYYGFGIGTEGVEWEQGKSVPNTRWKTLYSRQAQNASSLGRKELYLSKLLKSGQSPKNENERTLLQAVQILLANIEIAPYGDEYRHRRLNNIPYDIVNQKLRLAHITDILRIADVGITQTDIREEQISPALVQRMKKIEKFLREEIDLEGETSIDLETDETEAVIKALVFQHQGENEVNQFEIGEESDGTLAWLSLVFPAVEALRKGGVYVVDEIDNSLHPELLEAFIGFFRTPTLNPQRAQLLFTSHDLLLLSPLSDLDLDDEEIWFAEKSRDGSSELYSLADFPSRPDANRMRRYLAGRYGAIPAAAPSLINKVIRG